MWNYVGVTFKMTMVLQPLSHLPKTCLKLLYVLLVVLLTQVQFSVIFTIIYVENCDIERSVQGLSFLTSVEMVVIGLLGSVSFPLSDLLSIRAASVKPPHVSVDCKHIDFLF